eukprot:379932-Pleurochrysis_carterae.AAC.1
MIGHSSNAPSAPLLISFSMRCERNAPQATYMHIKAQLRTSFGGTYPGGGDTYPCADRSSAYRDGADASDDSDDDEDAQ